MSRLLNTTPQLDGFHMPGEFEPHSGCWMLWPERPDNWRYGAKPAQHAFVNVAKAISEGEPVTMAVSPRQFKNARAMLPPHIRVVEMTSNDSWMRDCGPVFVVNDSGSVRVVDWRFNAWGGIEGGLYFPWDQDDVVPVKIANMERLDLYQPPLVLEGGSIHVDGEGTLITTEECLLNENRNPQLGRQAIEAVLSEYLGIEKIIWLKRGVYNDETSGHVDNLCAFVRPGVIVLTWSDDPGDPQYEISREAHDILVNTTDARGRPLEIHKIHQPSPVIISREEAQGVDAVEGVFPRRAGDRLAASYINFYVGNGTVVVPSFDDPHDVHATEKLESLFPGRRIIPVAAREILLGGGNIHCITMQQPAPRRGHGGKGRP